MNKKRILSLALCLLMFGSALVSCGGDKETPADTTVAQNETTAVEDTAENTTADVTTAAQEQEEVNTYVPTFETTQSWHYGAQSDGGKHVLLCSNYKSKSFFDGCIASDALAGNTVNNFWTGDSSHTKGMGSANDPLFLSRFEATLYDYTYHIIYINYPNVNDETRENYLAGLQSMINLCHKIQPGTPVVYVNTSDVVTEGSEEEAIKNLFETNGEQFWDYYRGKQSAFLKQHKTFAKETEYFVREGDAIPEGSVDSRTIAGTKETLSWEISEINDPCKVENKYPRVLLVGDSITYGYREKVTKELKDQFYVDTYAISYAVSDAAVFRGMKYLLETYDYSVIHINIAFHNGTFDRGEDDNDASKYAEYLEELLKKIQETAPNAKIVFATGTNQAVNDGNGGSLLDENGKNVIHEKTYTMWKSRAEAAKTVCEKLGITVDDLWTLCDETNPKHGDGDDLHFAPEGNDILVPQIVGYIKQAAGIEA